MWTSDIEKTKDLEWIDHGDYAIAYDPINKVCLMKITAKDKDNKTKEIGLKNYKNITKVLD